ncbi:camphor resistance protein CrcB [Thermobifida fusca YX]|nr:camphor resistance protein CrcB [Thermobifida fusca YX]
MMTALLTAVGAAFGALLRYCLNCAAAARGTTGFPWGTWCVNTLGCLLAGALAALPLPAAVAALAGPGLCGGLTTYSTFSYETVRLLAERKWTHALGNIGANLAAGVGAAVLGMAAVGWFLR